MPTLAIKRDLLFDKVGRHFTDDQFDDLCFQFGIELDEITSERQQVSREQGVQAAVNLSDEVIYKIELPANRYDLMSAEGLSRAIKTYLSDAPEPVKYQVIPPKTKMIVKESVHKVRPYVVCAILRDFAFDQERYDAFIELQDKLHNGIGRKRTIVAVGTHDLDTLEGPFTYEALPPRDIQFRPLNQSTVMDGQQLMQHYETDLKIRKYLSIIRESPVYPVIHDSQRRVCSLPPIINGDHSKIRLSTRNILIELTGTDLNKLNTALTVMVSAFSEYCAHPRVIEAVEIVYPQGHIIVTPDMSSRTQLVDVEYINRCIGVNLDAHQMVKLLCKMMLPTEAVSEQQLKVEIPCTRSDILHACDIMEDVAIAYGFNNIEKTLPKTLCTAVAQPLNNLGDHVRREVALAGFTEVLTLTLCSKRENFAFLRRTDPGNEAVVLSNPKTLEYEIVHTSLMPEMLKTIAANKRMPLPLKIFQVADVVLLDKTTEVGARNERRLCAVYCSNSSSGFEIIHGLLDRVMQMMAVKPIIGGNSCSSSGYCIKPANLPYYFPGRQAQVLVDGVPVGSFGIVHPDVLGNFEVSNVCSLLEINIEHFL